MRQIVYSIEGNIGSGKSVLLQLIGKSLPNIVKAPEPLNDWQHISKHNLLQAYYDNPIRWAYSFQNYALLTRSNHLQKLLKGNVPKQCFLFSERSIEADKQIFARLLHRQGKMTDLEYQLYLRFYEDLSHLYNLPLVYQHIYLRTDPKRCLARIQKRGRNEETKISLDYLNGLHQMHQDWLGDKDHLIIDGTQEFQTNQQKLKEILNQINQWLKSHKNAN